MTVHAVDRYYERVAPGLPDWDRARAQLLRLLSRDGHIAGPPPWAHDRLWGAATVWLYIGDLAIVFACVRRGGSLRATTCLTPDGQRAERAARRARRRRLPGPVAAKLDREGIRQQRRFARERELRWDRPEAA